MVFRKSRSTYTSINNCHFDTVAHNTLVPQLVDLGHDMRREGILWDLPRLRRICLQGIFSCDPVNLVLGHIVEPDGPHLLYSRLCAQKISLVIGGVSVVEADGSALEELVIKLHPGRGHVLHGRQLRVNVNPVLVLDDERARDDIAGLYETNGSQEAAYDPESNHGASVQEPEAL